MNRKKLYLFILFSLIFMTTIPSVYSKHDTHSPNKPTCYDNGEVLIPSKSKDIEEIYMERVLTKTYEKINWSLEQFETEGKIMYRIWSEEGTFNHPETYKIDVNMSSPEESFTVKVTCPGLVFSCKLFNLDFKNCYNKDDTLYIYYIADYYHAKSYFTNIKYDWRDLTHMKHLVYAENSYRDINNYFIRRGELPIGSTVEEIEYQDDKKLYLIKASFKNNKVESVRLELDECKNTDYEYSYLTCNNKYCKKDSDCESYEVCDTNREFCVYNEKSKTETQITIETEKSKEVSQVVIEEGSPEVKDDITGAVTKDIELGKDSSILVLGIIGVLVVFGIGIWIGLKFKKKK